MSDTFQFDEVAFFKKFQEQFNRVNQAESTLTKTQQKFSTDAAASEEQLSSTFEEISRRSDTARNEALTALERLEVIQQNPQAINQFMGLFDPEFNERGLEIRAKRANLELQGLNAQSRNAQTLHGLNLSKASRASQAAKSTVLSERQKLENVGDILKLGIAVEDEVHEEDIITAQDMSLAELVSVREDIKNGKFENVPPGLADKPGLVETIIQDKQLKDLGVDASTIAVQRSLVQLEQEKTAQNLKNFTQEELIAMGRNGTFPEGLTNSVVATEIRRRDKQILSLRQVQQAIEAGDIELQRVKKNEVLSASTLEEMQEAFESAVVSENGTADVSRGGFTQNFTLEELNSVVQLKQGQRNEQIEALADQAALIGTTQGKAITNSLAINTISKQLSPGGIFDPSNPINTAPPEALVLLSENSARIQQLEQMKVGLPPSSSLAIDKKIAEQQLEVETKVNSLKDKILARTPRAERNATSEFLNNNGTVLNSQAAGSLLASTATNPEALNHNPNFSTKWKQLSEEFIRLDAVSSGSNIGLDPVTGFVDITKQGSQDKANIVETAMKTVGFRDGVSDILLQKTLAEAILDLQSKTRDKTSGKSPLDGIVDPSSGIFLPHFYRADPETGARSFDPSVFNVGLSQKNVELRKEGILDEHHRLQDIIFGETESLTRSLNFTDRNMRGNATEASIAAFAFNNNPGAFIRKKLVGLQVQVDNAEVRQKELQTQLNAEIKAIQDATETDPSLKGVGRGLNTIVPEEEAPKSIFDIMRR